MSYSFYKILHIVGILAIFMSLGALCLHTLNNGERKFPNRLWTMILHGIGMAFTLVAGFGLLARIGLTGAWPGWVWMKLAIWLSLGGVTTLILTKKVPAKVLWVAILGLGGLAAFLANYKPF